MSMTPTAGTLAQTEAWIKKCTVDHISRSRSPHRYQGINGGVPESEASLGPRSKDERPRGDLKGARMGQLRKRGGVWWVRY